MHLVRRNVTAVTTSRTAYQLAFGLRISTVTSTFSAKDGKGYTSLFHRKISNNNGGDPVVHEEGGERETCVVSAALAFLEGKKRIVEELRPEDYSKVDTSIGASVGGHVRHSLDHFARCLAILNDNSDQTESGGREQDNKENSTSIRYDHRERGGTVETDPAGAFEVILFLLEQLRALPRGKAGSEKLRGILVTPAFFLGSAGASADGDQEHRFLSNLERELFFCCHHGMHHDAMIRLILKGMAESGSSGAARALVEGGKGLGVAPSTVDFREKQQQQHGLLDD